MVRFLVPTPSLPATQGEVVDNGDGSYRMDVAVDAAGQWVLHPTIGGQALRPDGIQTMAVHGPLQPAQLALVGGVDSAVCGTTDVLLVKVRPADGGDRHRMYLVICMTCHMFNDP